MSAKKPSKTPIAILDEDYTVVNVDQDTYNKWWQQVRIDPSKKHLWHLKNTTTTKAQIHTIFLSHPWYSNGQYQYFESWVHFHDQPESMDLYQNYDTYNQAIQGHEALVKQYGQ